MASSVVAMLAPSDETNQHLLNFTPTYKDATEALDALVMIPVLQELNISKASDVLAGRTPEAEELSTEGQERNPQSLIYDLETHFRTCAGNEVQIVSSIPSYVQTLEPTLMMGKSGSDLADILKLMLQMNVDQSAENAASRKKDLIEFSETLKAIQITAAEIDMRMERLSLQITTHRKDAEQSTLSEAIHESLANTLLLATDEKRAKIQIAALFEVPIEGLDEKLGSLYTNKAKEIAISTRLENFRHDLNEIHTSVEALLGSMKTTYELADALAGMWNSVFTRLEGLESISEPIDPSLAAEVTMSWSASCITAETFVTVVTGVMEQKAQNSAMDEQEQPEDPIASDPSMLTMLNLENEADVRA